MRRDSDISPFSFGKIIRSWLVIGCSMGQHVYRGTILVAGDEAELADLVTIFGKSMIRSISGCLFHRHLWRG